MEKKKYKIVVLADLKKSVATTLKSAVSIAKLIHGDIYFFYVKNAVNVVERDNQLSAIRSINQDYAATNKKIKKLVDTVSNEFQVKIHYSFAFGNVKHEIDQFVKEQKPDIIVLGKKKFNPLSLVGDNMIQFVLKQYHGTVFIADSKNTIEPNDKLSLGILNSFETTSTSNLIEDLLAHAQKPIKSFQIVEKVERLDQVNVSAKVDTVNYVFQQNDNSIKNLSTYLTKNNINLLYVDRMETTSKSKSNAIKQNIKDMSKLNVSLLLTGQQNNTIL